MREWPLCLIVIGLLATVVTASCRRADIETIVINVPELKEGETTRIITNAALAEVATAYDPVQHQVEVDLARKTVVYYESPRLLSPDYCRFLEKRIGEVGFEAEVRGVRPDPPPPTPTVDGPAQTWPTRCTAMIFVADMDSRTDANIVVDALTYARLGGDDPRIVVDQDGRRVVATCDGMLITRKNLEHAIASVGFVANDVPARSGQPDAVPDGWTAVRL